MGRIINAFIAVIIGTVFIVPGSVSAKVTLRFSHWDSNPGIIQAIKAWNAKNPGIQVSYEPLDWTSYFQKIPVQIAAGSPPDIFSELLVNGKFWALARKGVIKDLTPYFKSDLDVKEFFPAAIDAASVNKRIYAMPMGISNGGFLYYNTNLFEQAGVPVPNAGWTLDDFEGAARRLTRDANGDGKPDLWGFHGFSNVLQLFDQVASGGGRVYNAAGTKMDLSSPEAMRALRWRYEFDTKAKATGGDYSTGKTAMFAGSPQWMINTLRVVKGKFKTAVTHWPKDNATGFRRFEPDPEHLCIPANSKHFKEAWKFLKWYTSAEGLPSAARSVFGASQLVPARRAVARSDMYLKPNQDFIPPTFDMRVIVQGIEDYSVPTQQVNNGYDIRRMIDTEYARAKSGAFSLEQFVKRVTQQGDALLARNRDRK